jgi:serine/threonine-protein kinase RsbW
VPTEASKTDDLGAWTEKILPTNLAGIRESERDLLARLAAVGYDEDHRFAVRLAFEEAMVNAMKHGNKMDPSRSVTLSYRVSPERVEIRVADEGPGFDPGGVPDPTADENLNKPCGRGIMLMRCYMDEVAYSSSGKEVRMVKYRQP